MNSEYIKNIAHLGLTPTHQVAFYGIESWRNSYIADGVKFNAATDLSGDVSDGLGGRVIDALESFGVNGVRVNGIDCGPVVTRVYLALPSGLHAKTVTDLARDMSLQLKAKVSFTDDIGKGVVAMDIPAEKRKVVLPGNVHGAAKEGMVLPLELGVTVNGTPKAIDLAKAPHLLIAGQTGSGKSVCINSIICSLLRNVPLNEFDMMLVDPKGVELGDYAKMPNVINNEVLVSPTESLDGLRWLCKEMDRRYTVLHDAGNKKDIVRYNEWVAAQPVGTGCACKMRYIVCVVDEFADLMQTAGAELTSIVQRLTQKSRAVGIHLVLATQRPSVKVITGEIKANLPCRIAFKVSSAIDSVTIINRGGAENLLGKGDMIIYDDGNYERLHGVYLDDKYIAYFLNLIYRSTVGTMVRHHDFATGKLSVLVDGHEVPYWLFETMNDCAYRPVSAESPDWVASLVGAHNAVWKIDNIGSRTFTMAVLVCRMASRYASVERLRKVVDPFITSCDFVSERNVDHVAELVLDAMTRLSKASSIGLGFTSSHEVTDAFNHTIPVNWQCAYLRDLV